MYFSNPRKYTGLNENELSDMLYKIYNNILYRKETFLFHHSSSLILMITFAVMMKYKEIVLIGFDLYDNNYFNRGILEFDRSDNDVIDFSIFKIFQLIKNGYLDFNESVFTTKIYTDISRFNLPNEYISVVTTSNRDPIHKARGRNLTEFEIERIVDYCNAICLVEQVVDFF